MNNSRNRETEQSSAADSNTYKVPALRGSAKSKWTIAGVSAETRTAVKKAAHKEGVTIGVWVDRVLNTAAEDALKGGSPLLSLPPDLLVLIDEMSRKLDQISGDVQQDPKKFAPLSQDLRDFLDDLQERTAGGLDQIRKSAQSVADTASAQADSAVTQSKEVVGRTLDRLVDAGDAALDTVRHYRENNQDNDAEPSDRDDSAAKETK